MRFDVGGPLAPGEEPFDIAGYESTAAQVTTMTQELTTLVSSLNQLLASPNVQDGLPLAFDAAQDRSEEFVRYLVLLGIVLMMAVIFTLGPRLEDAAGASEGTVDPPDRADSPEESPTFASRARPSTSATPRSRELVGARSV